MSLRPRVHVGIVAISVGLLTAGCGGASEGAATRPGPTASPTTTPGTTAPAPAEDVATAGSAMSGLMSIRSTVASVGDVDELRIDRVSPKPRDRFQ